MRHAPLTDAVIREALIGLTAGPTSDDLLAGVLREVDRVPQVHRRFGVIDSRRRLVITMLAAMLLLAALIGALIVGTRVPPIPLTHQSTIFELPFRYELPAGMKMKTTMLGSSIVELTVDGGHGEERGITVAIVDAGVDPHEFANNFCFGPYPPIDSPPDSSLVGLINGFNTVRSGFLGVVDMTVPKVAPTTLDGWPAETGRVEAGRCPTLSVRVGPALTRDQPGVLTAAQLGNSRAVLVSVWASDATTLDSWLPAGSQILQSIHFFDPAKTGH